MDFSNKVVVITGASAGIGASTALFFAYQSAKLVLVGRNDTALQEIALKCQNAKDLKPLIVKADVTNDDDVKNIVTTTIEEFGRIDVLVNNAGVGAFATITDGIEFYDKVMNTNMRSAYLLTSHATPYLIESKGNIVNVSSVASIKLIPHLKFLPYGISKAAMDHFTKRLALDLGFHGVRVNSVNPGATKTSFVLTAGISEAELNEITNNHIKKKLPLGKMAEADEVAELILYLASDKARSITGSIFVLDNGELLI